MAWSASWPLAAGAEIQSGLFGELATAYRERRVLLGQSDPGAYGGAGTDLQAYSGPFASSQAYRRWQDWIEANYAAWVDTSRGYDRAGAPALTANWVYTTLAQFRTAASLDAAGFTRKYWREFTDGAATTYTDGNAFADGHKALNQTDGAVYERVAGAWVRLGGCFGGRAPDTVTTHGKIQPGDILGVWVYNELYQCFRAMRWTLTAGAYNGVGVSYNDAQYDNLTPGTGTWAGTKANVETTWDAQAGSTATGNQPDFSMWTRGDYPGRHVAEMSANRLRVTDGGVPPVTIAHTAEFYVYSTKVPRGLGAAEVYDDNGVGLAEDDWALVDTVGPSAVTPRVSRWMGSVTAADGRPAWCADPQPLGIGMSTGRGFVSADVPGVHGRSAVINRWDCAGGFSKP